MKQFVRKPIMLWLAAILLAAFIPAFTLFSGQSSAARAAASPVIVLTPNSSFPGSKISVAGSNFKAGETVHIYFQRVSNGIVSTEASNTGTFTVSLKIPVMAVKTGTTYFVYAVGTMGTDHAKASFTFEQPFLFANDIEPVFGTKDGFGAFGFGVGETVDLVWDYQQQGQVQIARATASENGEAIFSIAIPSNPATSNVNVAAIGTTTTLIATTQVFVTAGLVLSPSQGHVGTTLHVRGGGFDANETVTLSYEGTTVATPSTDSMGGFTTSFVVPNTIISGIVTVQATGESSAISASAQFTVLADLKITPTTGPSGTVITLTGKGYAGFSLINIYWYDPHTKTKTFLSSISTSATGTFTTTITAPSGLTSGNTYFVQTVDTTTTVTTQAEFVAQ